FHLGADVLLVDRGHAPTEQQEELDVARRTGERTGRHRHGAIAALRCGGRHGGHGLRTKCEVAHDTALAHTVLAYLELRLDHQGEFAVRSQHGDERVQHQPQRDEREVPDHQVDGPVDQVEVEVADVRTVVH